MSIFADISELKSWPKYVEIRHGESHRNGRCYRTQEGD